MTTVALPSLAGVPHVVALSAADDRGRVAHDRAAILPRGWLASKLARSIASAIVFTALDPPSLSGDGLGRCTRLSAARVDCALVPDRGCEAVATIRLGTDGRLRWGTYRCPIARARPLIRRLRALRRSDMSCESSESSCPPPLFGLVADRWLVPWD